MKKLSLITTAACVAMFAYAGATNSFVHAEDKSMNSVFEQDTIRTPRDTSRIPRIPVPSEPIPTPRPDDPNPSPTPLPPRDPSPNPVPMPTDPMPDPTPTDPNPMLK